MIQITEINNNEIKLLSQFNSFVDTLPVYTLNRAVSRENTKLAVVIKVWGEGNGGGEREQC